MKLKAKAKDCQLLVKVKIASNELLDEKELDRFSRLFLRGFLKPKLVKKNVIEYTGPVGVSLYERFKRPVSKREFLFILEQLVVAVQKLQANKLAINHLMMRLEYAYINEVTKEIQLVYVPMVAGLQNLNLIEFIERIAYSIKPADEEDNEFVARFIYFFKALKPFDINKVEAFVVKEDRSVVNTIRKHNAGQSGFMTNKPQHYYEHYEEKGEVSEEVTDLLPENDDDPTGLLTENQEEVTDLLDVDDEATGLLDGAADEDEATGLLVDEGQDDATGLLVEEAENVCFPSLFRILTEETICINKPVFRLGKEKSYVDYFVTNNVAVSRSHADIITRGNTYFVKDLNSKNRTYINNRELPIHVEVEIFDGDRLRLGNEEFVFRV